MTQTYWIGYAPARQEFTARDKIAEAGITCIVPRKVDLIRQGKRRWPDPVTSPALLSYVFIMGTDQDWHRVNALNVLRPTSQFISQRSWETLMQFNRRTEQDYTARMDAINAGQRVAQYKPGEVLRITAGPLAGQLATFTRMIEGAGQFPEIEASVEIMGGHVKTRLDPLHASPVANP